MGLRTEKFYPVTTAFAAGVGWYFLSQKFALRLPPDEKEFFAAALSMGAVLTGFIATAQAILMALPTDSVMGRLRSSGYIHELVSYLASALLAGFAFCILNLVGFSLISSTVAVKLIFSTLWIMFAVYAGLSFLRVSGIMFRIMKQH
jgi:hypothetical protein